MWTRYQTDEQTNSADAENYSCTGGSYQKWNRPTPIESFTRVGGRNDVRIQKTFSGLTQLTTYGIRCQMYIFKNK
jgi:hypothetical protein